MTRQDTSSDPIREALIAAVLGHVPFDGWGEKALLAAAGECEIEAAAARRAFPRGGASLIQYHAARTDRCMEEGLGGAEALKGRGVRQRIAAAVRLRLELEQPHREAVRAALAFCAMPQNAGLSLACLYHTVDTVWFAIGDKSTDFNFYSKRALLAGAYGTTLLYWLDDSSENYEESWAFLDRRLEDVMRVGRVKANLQRLLPSPQFIANLLKNGPGWRPDAARYGRTGRP
jgi:ubiquinone biosynthesis protein COQ9